jgi:hypothetical protein
MLRLSQHANESLPKEYQKIAGQIFPVAEALDSKNPSLDAIISFAEMLGIGADFSKVLKSAEAESSIKKLLDHFQNNLDLLIQKTWVDKDDEARKEKLQDKVPHFIAVIEAGEYKKSIADFGIILDELAHLFFGAQSKKDDFIEYVFRIDEQMGLFWWYGGNLPSLAEIKDNEYLRAALLIGICYLTNF